MDRQRQMLVRRVIAVGIGVLILILLLLGVRGCLNARAERGLENYASDLDSIVTQANQLSQEFFARLQDPPPGLTELQLGAEAASDRGTAESLLQRVEGLDAPDDLSHAQEELVGAFELRRDALAGIAEDIPTALGNEGRVEATERIAGDMRGFLASDVLFERGRLEIESVLADEGIEARVEASPFLPEPLDRWLDDLQLATVLSVFAADTDNAGRGIRGLTLLETSIGDTPLTPEVENTVSIGNDPPDITIDVQNSGEVEENDVLVRYTLSGGPAQVEGQAVIDSLDSQGTDSVTIGFETVPEPDLAQTLEVVVFPVPGEALPDNNGSTYTVVFN